MGPIDRSSSYPYYLQLAEILKQEIDGQGTPVKAYQLPSENELASLHAITRATVRRALDILERDGCIDKEEGKGSSAVVRHAEHELTQLVSTTEDVGARGWPLATQVVSLERVPANPKIAQALELSEGMPLMACAACALSMVSRSACSHPIFPLPSAPTSKTTTSRPRSTGFWRAAMGCACGLAERRFEPMCPTRGTGAAQSAAGHTGHVHGTSDLCCHGGGGRVPGG
jgi:DNA-binding transcriptional regulator YhcF (GntR family)